MQSLFKIQILTSFTMYRITFLPILKRHLSICKILKCFPFEFDTVAKTFKRTGSVSHQKLFRLQCLLSILLLPTMLLNLSFGHFTTPEMCHSFHWHSFSCISWLGLSDGITIWTIPLSKCLMASWSLKTKVG